MRVLVTPVNPGLLFSPLQNVVFDSTFFRVRNIPSHIHIENLKRLCRWLELLRTRRKIKFIQT